MHILVLGGGLMGPAAAAEALRDPATTGVTVADISQSSLEACMARIAGEPRAERLRIEVADVRDASAINRLLVRADAVISALPVYRQLDPALPDRLGFDPLHATAIVAPTRRFRDPLILETTRKPPIL